MNILGLNNLIEANHILPSLSLEITDCCNLKCVHCYVKNRSVENEKNCLNIDEIKDILEQAKRMNVFKITITGGEPFSHPQIIEILSEIKNQNFICYVLTNGTLINDRNIKTIKKCVNKLFLSNYGFSKDTYESVTKVLNSRKMYESGIKLLIKYNIPFEERIILLKENETEVSKFVNSGLQIETCICGDRKNNYAIYHRPSDYALKYVFGSRKSSYKILTRKLDDKVCNLGCSSLTIKASGEVTPCNNYCFSLGNIKNDNLISIWTGEKLQEIKEKIKYNNFKKCLSCQYQQFSDYILPCNNFQENGDPSIPSLETCRHCRLLKNTLCRTGKYS